MSFQIDQIDPFHPHFDSLVRELNAYLKSVDGDDNEFYNQFNSSDDLDFAFVGYLERLPVKCAGLKSYESDRYELKRMRTDCKLFETATTTPLFNSAFPTPHELARPSVYV